MKILSKEYIKVQDLGMLKCASDCLRGVIPENSEIIDREEFNIVVRSLSKWIELHYSTIDTIEIDKNNFLEVGIHAKFIIKDSIDFNLAKADIEREGDYFFLYDNGFVRFSRFWNNVGKDFFEPGPKMKNLVSKGKFIAGFCSWDSITLNNKQL